MNSWLKKHPVLQSLFEYSTSKLKAEVLEDMFVPEFSPVGSNDRAKKAAVVMWFTELVHEVEGLSF